MAAALPTRNQLAVIGTGYSTIARRSQVGLGALAVEAVRHAADDAGLQVQDIDGICTYTRPAEAMPGFTDGFDFVGVDFLVRTLGLKGIRWYASLDRSVTVAAFIHALHAVFAGECRYALVYRAMHNPGGALLANRFAASFADQGRQFQAPYGLGAQLMSAALTYSEYMGRYGATREDMATFIVNNRRNAAMNPDAVFFEKPITYDDYMSSRILSWPMALLDCDMPVDGVSALIVTTADRAKELVSNPVYIAGYATLGFDYLHAQGFGTWETNMTSVKLISHALWRNSGLKASDVDMASLYDGFSYLTYMWLEGFGFCAEGEAHEFIQDGRISLDGELPLNTSGGSLGAGRLHGGPQLIEAVRQIQGRCGPRQVKEAQVTLANAGAPTGGCSAVLFTKEPVT